MMALPSFVNMPFSICFIVIPSCSPARSRACAESAARRLRWVRLVNIGNRNFVCRQFNWRDRAEPNTYQSEAVLQGQAQRALALADMDSAFTVEEHAGMLLLVNPTLETGSHLN